VENQSNAKAQELRWIKIRKVSFVFYDILCMMEIFVNKKFFEIFAPTTLRENKHALLCFFFDLRIFGEFNEEIDVRSISVL
jgi:hypothetical protein